MNNDIYQKILQDHRELASLPQTLAEVIRVTRDETSSAQDLADVIMRDPALTAKVLRIVNSPFYGARREITTISQAVMTIGTRAVSALALSTSIYDMTGKWEFTIDRLRFWRHSLEVAVGSREIAHAIGYAYPEEAFIAGLLHDLGLLVMEKSFPDKFSRLWKRMANGEQLYEMEDQTWGTNHAKVGQFLMEQWHLPEVLTQAIGFHHLEIVPTSDEPELRLSQIVVLANSISRFKINNLPEKAAVSNQKISQLCKRLNIESGQLINIEKSLIGRTIEEANFLEIDLGSSHDLLLEANRIIYEQYAMVEKLLEENETMQQEILQSRMEKAALESLRTISATFNHYINNAAATILGRAQLVQVGLRNGEIKDSNGSTNMAMEIIISGVNTVKTVMDEIKNLQEFKTTLYHDDAYILDLEDRIKAKLAELRDGIEVPVR